MYLKWCQTYTYMISGLKLTLVNTCLTTSLNNIDNEYPVFKKKILLNDIRCKSVRMGKVDSKAVSPGTLKVLHFP